MRWKSEERMETRQRDKQNKTKVNRKSLKIIPCTHLQCEICDHLERGLAVPDGERGNAVLHTEHHMVRAARGVGAAALPLEQDAAGRPEQQPQVEQQEAGGLHEAVVEHGADAGERQTLVVRIWASRGTNVCLQLAIGIFYCLVLFNNVLF